MKITRRLVHLCLLALAIESIGCRGAETRETPLIRLVEHLVEAQIEWPESVLRAEPRKPPAAAISTEKTETYLRRVMMGGSGDENRSRVATAGVNNRLAVISPDGGSYRFQVAIPDEAVFRIGLGYVPPVAEIDQQIRYVVSLESAGETSNLIDESLVVTPFRSWKDQEIDLSPWSGKTVSLVLKTTYASDAGPLWAAWSNPRIAGVEDTSDCCNVVLVSLDTLRADRLGCYGHDRPTSPNLDALAERGVIFQTAVSQSPWTRPSHRAMLSGVYPVSTQELPRVPLAWQFWQAGYQTWAVTEGGQIHPRFGFVHGFDEYRIDRWIEKVPELLEQFAGKTSRRQFLFIHTYEIHDPYRHTEFAQGPPPGRIKVPFALNSWRAQAKWTGPATAEEREFARALYDSGIAYVDRKLGEFFSGLEARGFMENTVIIVTSDHGEQLWEHPGLGHGFHMYDEQVLVPLIIYLPPQLRREAGIRREGLVIRDQVQLVDIYPTLLELLHIPRENQIHGRSVVPLLKGGELPQADAFSEHTNSRIPRRALRSARYKFIKTYPSRNHEKDHELYDLREDPAERINLASEHPDLIAALNARLQAITQGRAQAESSIEELEDLDPALRKQLEALGYLDN